MTIDAARQFRLALVLFFGSGMCALAYETVWVRQLTLSFGISVYAVSAVLAAYMFGLCVGAFAVGRLAHRIRNPLRVYALFELGIVAYTLLLYFVLADLVPGLYRLSYGLLAENAALVTPVTFGAAFVLLAIPTMLMGGTLPVLSGFLCRTDADVGGALGRLYGINTLGGVAGTALAGFWLLKDLGIFATTLVALAVNFAIALAALWYSRGAEGEPIAPAPAARAPAPRVAQSRLVAIVLVLSGFTALSYQVIWNRSLLLYTHNSTYAFSTILIVFLLGTSLGSLLYSRVPSHWEKRRTLGIVQLALGAFVWLSIPMTGALPEILARVTEAVGTGSWLAAMVTVSVSAIAIVFLPTLLMGFTFPAATALLSARREEIASVTGSAYAFLTVGNILGSLVTGFLLIEWVGLRNSFAVGIFCNLLGGLALVTWGMGVRRALAVSAAGAAVGVALFSATIDRDIYRTYYERFGEKASSKILFYKEEVTDNVLVLESDAGDRFIFYSDGRGTAGTSTDFMNRMSGHIPMLLHPEPRSVLSICFGVGNTLSALAQHSPEDLTCVELSPGAIEAAPFFPSNLDVLDTPNLKIHIDDGRNFLLGTDERYDVIQLEPPELHQAGVVNLYTREFYELARNRLNERGVVCQWYSTLMPEHERRMVVRAFIDVFPYSGLWSGSNFTSFVLVGSTRPTGVSPEQFLANAGEPAVRADLERMGLDAFDVLARHLMGPASLRRYVGDTPSITDDRTYVDFSIPRSREAGFGVFVYNTFQDFSQATPAVFDMFDSNFRIEGNAESPAYLFDFAGTPAPLRDSFMARLTAAQNAYVARVQGDHLALLAEKLLGDGKALEAEAKFRDAVRRNPEQAWARFRIAQLLLRRNEAARAEQQLVRALATSPDLLSARKLLAEIRTGQP